MRKWIGWRKFILGFLGAWIIIDGIGSIIEYLDQSPLEHAIRVARILAGIALIWFAHESASYRLDLKGEQVAPQGIKIEANYRETDPNVCRHCHRWVNDRCTEAKLDVHYIFPSCFLQR